MLVSRNGALALVDLTGRTVVAELTGVPWDARISVAGDIAWIAGSSLDGMGTSVRRVRIGADSLVEEGAWSTPGWLLDARRSGDRLHVVVVDQPYEAGVIPFEGGPVPCEDVWHPTADVTTPAATLVASLPSTGAVAPVAAAEVTGSGGNILSPARASTSPPRRGRSTAATSPPACTVSTSPPSHPPARARCPGGGAGRFALDEHDGYLRVATTLDSFGFFAVEGDVGTIPVMVDPATDLVEDVQAATAAAQETPTASGGSDPTATTVPDDETTTTVTEPDDTTTVDRTR